MTSPLFVDWFNPYNIEHLRAYRYVQDTGTWPPRFIPDNLLMGNNWQVLLQFRLAEAWVNYKLGERT